jgi:predicted secreted hydrolase
VRRFFTSLVLLAAMVPVLSAAQPMWSVARPGWTYEFPRDHFSHPDFKTEWWYFTGNLAAEDGREFGYQLTFFRQGVRRGDPAETKFAVEDIKLAHFAITEVSAGRFHFAQRVSRGAFGEAGFSDGDRIAWIKDWQLRQTGEGSFALQARDTDFGLSLQLTARKPPVFHGADGLSQKAEGEGRASHYYSLTRLEAEGTITLGAEKIRVQGWSWFDQEWATNQLAANQTGWDWLSLQFADNTELMVFQIRLADGGRDSHSHGTWIDAEGRTTPIEHADFELVPGRTWRSPQTGGVYPMAWNLRLAKLGLDLEVTAALPAQELVLKPIAYWEGSVRALGTRGDRPITGRGYLEMTGYAGGLVGLQAPETR